MNKTNYYITRMEKKVKNKKTVPLLIREIPEDIHRKFKSKVALEGTDMQAKTIELIREYIKK